MYCGTGRSLERMIRSFESGNMYPPFDRCVDARVAYDAVAATDACEPAGASLKPHLFSVRNRMAHGLVRKSFWVDARDMLADGPTNGGIERTLLHNVGKDCLYQAIHECLEHRKNSVASFAASPPEEEPPEKEGL